MLETASATAECVEADVSPKNGPAIAPPRDTAPRISERDLAFAIAAWLDAWLDGDDFAAQGHAFRPYHGINLRLIAEGDELVHRNRDARCVVLDRAARRVVAWDGQQGGNCTEAQEARAIAAYVIRGDHEIMWRKPRMN